MKKDEKMSIEDMTAYMRIVPERKASYAEFPDTMNERNISENRGLMLFIRIRRKCLKRPDGERIQ